MAYLVIIIFGVVAYGLSDNEIYLILCCMLPLAGVLIIYTSFYYQANDYNMLKDIEAENAKRRYLKKMRNKELEKSRKFE